MNLPNVTLRQLEYLVAVAETGSLTAAAARCHVSQGAISLALSELERVLDLRLVVRSPRRGAALTAAGVRVLADARRVVGAMSDLGAEARGLSRQVGGVLTVGCYAPIAPFHLPAAIATFERAHPDVSVRFVEGSLPEIGEDLITGRCEIAFLYDQDLVPGIATRTLYDQPPRVLLPAGHRLRRRRSVALRELADDPFVLLDVPPSERYFRSVFTAAGAEMVVTHRARSFELARSLVARGIGYSITVQQPALSTSYEGLEVITVALRDKVPTTPVVLGWAAGGPLTRRAQAFADHCATLWA
ncbi:DNA-binding transcriptional regulator, LysR family [Lentzea albidocapillata subsp. violacea]|uniref:DNA-binding transcriptional regulator, LysR family n=1 Tax=Lentzea albidocapillata subsp. violacea TaxID=128104 RepID=A0A1G9PBZ6_9PSEU|nr:LysR family transcriptional regulator [Lentzea albidocapillata]SDL96392.1 DNA-binding transcriptional regulator, LysR family [Lentzea albidocapillata subsp. violacea]